MDSLLRGLLFHVVRVWTPLNILLQLTTQRRWGLFTPFNYLPLMAVSSGMSEDLATYTVAITK